MGAGGVNILEDARQCSVLYICKYFLEQCHRPTCEQLLREFFLATSIILAQIVHLKELSHEMKLDFDDMHS
jgi:hypothetical protein